MKYKIIVDKQSRLNPTTDKREYTIDIEELRFKGDVYDSLIITADEDYVLRRLKLTEYYVLEELEEPVKEPLESINIELFEGDNYIYLVDMTGNKFYAEYLIKNDFNDTYATRKEMNSAIDLTAQDITLAVNQKLQNYSTTEEVNSAINLKANEINAKVEKKVDEDTVTGAYLILKINGDTSEAKLTANKIELSANDVLNLLAGNSINLSSKNIAIISDNFNVDKNGNVIIGGDINNPALKIMNSINKIQVSPSRIWLKHNDITALWLAIDSNGKGSLAMPNDAEANFYGSGAGTTINSQKISTPVLYAPVISQTSQEKNKKNFEKLQDHALEIIKQIDIYKYNLKNEKDTDKKHIGFVIGNNYKYSKEVTSLDNTGVDTYSFVSLCCKAIQELNQQVEELKEKEDKNG